MCNFFWWLISVCVGYAVFCIVYSIAGGGIHDMRFLSTCDYLCDYINYNTKAGSAPRTVEVIYKNKLFNVGILFEQTNGRYGLYRISINGEDAANFHVLREYCGGRCCTLEPVNGRDENEVEKIVFAAVKMLKKQDNPKPIPESKAKSYFN